MDLEKIGLFISTLRKEKNLSQQQLADQLFISREAISKWERGKNLPDSSYLLKLSEIFNVSINEILYGEKRNNINSKNIDNITIDIYAERNKFVKYLKFAFVVLVILIFSFFSYYFINNYKSIKVYTINFSDDSLVIKDGIFVVTKDKLYFNLGKVSSDENITGLKLYEKKNDEERLIVMTEDSNIFIYDYYGYSEYFDYNRISDIINNLYLDIFYFNEVQTIKLELKRDFVNDKFINKKNVSITDYENDDKEINCKIYDDIILKNNLQKESENVYVYKNKSDNIYLTLFDDGKTLILDKIEKDVTKTWTYDLNSNYLNFQEYENNKEIFSFIYDGCLSNESLSSKEEELVNYFYKIIDDIYKF